MNRSTSRPVPTLVKAVLLLACSALVGLAVNHRLVVDAFSGRLTASAETDASETASLDTFPVPALLADIDGLLAQDALLVDARPQDLYALEHIAGAMSLPLIDLETAFPEFRAQVPRERPVITYCSGYGCQDSFDLAMRLILDGYTSVYVYEGGLPEWQAAGRPVEGEAP